MKKLLWSLFIFIALCCAGCTMHNTSIWTDDYIANIELAKKNAVKLAQISEFKTCFIRTCLGCHIDELPHKMVLTLDAIDELLTKIKDVENMTDCQKGQILALWTRLTALGILEIIEGINPGVLAELL